MSLVCIKYYKLTVKNDIKKQNWTNNMLIITKRFYK